MLYLRSRPRSSRNRGKQGGGGGGAGAGDIATALARGELCSMAGGGEEVRTRGLKLCPPWVLAMLGLRKRWRGWRNFATPEKQNTKS